MNNIGNENNKEIIRQFFKTKCDDDFIDFEEDELFIRKNIILNMIILHNDIENLLYSKIALLITKSDINIDKLIGINDYINSEIKLKIKNYYNKHNKNHNNLIGLHKRKEFL